MSQQPLKSHKDLRVWQRARLFVKDVYTASALLPASENYGLVSQLRWAAVSIPANLAEGNARRSRKDYAHFVSIASGSASEIETLLLLAGDLGFLKGDMKDNLLGTVGEIARMLNALQIALKKTDP